MIRSPSMIRIGEFSDPLGLLGLDLASLSVELVVEGLAGRDDLLQLFAVLRHHRLLVVELLARFILLEQQQNMLRMSTEMTKQSTVGSRYSKSLTPVNKTPSGLVN